MPCTKESITSPDHLRRYACSQSARRSQGHQSLCRAQRNKVLMSLMLSTSSSALKWPRFPNSSEICADCERETIRRMLLALAFLTYPASSAGLRRLCSFVSSQLAKLPQRLLICTVASQSSFRCFDMHMSCCLPDCCTDDLMSRMTAAFLPQRTISAHRASFFRGHHQIDR